MDVPETRYATSADGFNIAYQVFGHGPPVVIIPPLISNVEMGWEHELFRHNFEYLARHIRMAHFDKRGIGASDGFDAAPTLDQRISDIEAVMDAAGMERASLVGLSEGGLMTLLFACRHPERVDRVLVINCLPGARAVRQLVQEDPRWDLHRMSAAWDRVVETWGRDPAVLAEWVTPSRASNEPFVHWLGRYSRATASPAALRRQLDSVWRLQGVDDLTAVEAPTLVAHATGDQVVPPSAGRWLADHIPGARFMLMDSDDHFIWVDAKWQDHLDAWLEFLLDGPVSPAHSREFAVVLFTDVVGSTAASSAVGDGRWSTTIDGHDRVSRSLVSGSGGRLVKQTGDGILATFASPSTAARAALALRRELMGADLHVRIGVHAGEVEVHDDGDITGLAVNIAARVQAAAVSDEILVTSTMRDLLLGSGHTTTDRGDHELKGIEGAWRLHALEG